MSIREQKARRARLTSQISAQVRGWANAVCQDFVRLDKAAGNIKPDCGRSPSWQFLNRKQNGVLTDLGEERAEKLVRDLFEHRVMSRGHERYGLRLIRVIEELRSTRLRKKNVEDGVPMLLVDSEVDWFCDSLIAFYQKQAVDVPEPRTLKMFFRRTQYGQPYLEKCAIEFQIDCRNRIRQLELKSTPNEDEARFAVSFVHGVAMWSN